MNKYCKSSYWDSLVEQELFTISEALGFTGVRVVHCVQLHILACLFPCCEVRYDVRLNDVRLVFTPICFVGEFIIYHSYLFLLTFVFSTISITYVVRFV